MINCVGILTFPEISDYQCKCIPTVVIDIASWLGKSSLISITALIVSGICTNLKHFMVTYGDRVYLLYTPPPYPPSPAHHPLTLNRNHQMIVTKTPYPYLFVVKHTINFYLMIKMITLLNSKVTETIFTRIQKRKLRSHIFRILQFDAESDNLLVHSEGIQAIDNTSRVTDVEAIPSHIANACTSTT